MEDKKHVSGFLQLVSTRARVQFALADILHIRTSRMRVPAMSKLLSSVRQVHAHALWLKAQSLAALDHQEDLDGYGPFISQNIHALRFTAI